MRGLWVGLVAAVVIAGVVGGLIGFKIESSRADTRRSRDAATIGQLRQRLTAAESMRGVVRLSMAQLHAVERLNTPDSGGEATALGIGDAGFVIRRVAGTRVRAYFCDPPSLQPGTQIGRSAWTVTDTGRSASVKVPTDLNSPTADWGPVDDIALAEACAANR